MEGMHEAIRAGLAVTLTVESVVRALGPQSAIAFRPISGLEPVDFCLCWHSGDDRAEVKDFIQATLATCRHAGDRPAADRATA
jgi:DNA-binding transcriptional LysR family regulator